MGLFCGCTGLFFEYTGMYCVHRLSQQSTMGHADSTDDLRLLMSFREVHLLHNRSHPIWVSFADVQGSFSNIQGCIADSTDDLRLLMSFRDVHLLHKKTTDEDHLLNTQKSPMDSEISKFNR